MKLRLMFCIVSILLMASISTCLGNIIYVNLNSPGPSFNGTSWATSFHTVQAGLNAASSGDEVWVAKGTYVENITLTAGVGLYGGFTGTEASRDQRNFKTNQTILDGSRAGSVVTCLTDSPTSTTIIDGFTIQNGSSLQGAGIYCSSTSPTIRNNVITNNHSDVDAYGFPIYVYGGGIYCSGGSPIITNNSITSN